MVMVLLFLGVVFLLVGFQAMGSDGDSDSESSPLATTTITPTKTSPSPKPQARADVRVYNLSSAEGAAQNTADQLRDAGWNVTETGNLSLPDVPETTVFFSDAPGERQAADEVGRLLEVPVQPRLPELAEQPPGVIVTVTG
jgi:LytR cell envelope-related transcriptional attenuator